MFNIDVDMARVCFGARPRGGQDDELLEEGLKGSCRVWSVGASMGGGGGVTGGICEMQNPLVSSSECSCP